nr:type IV secretion IcmS family protein [Coxiella-like endosymbiont of Rhipicephalus sanguineus]
MSSLCLGYTLDATYEDTEQSLLDVKITFDEFTPGVLWLFYLLNELVKNSSSKDAVSLDELMYH